MKIISVNIRKPIYGNHVYINATVVNKAIAMGAMLEITVPNGKAIMDPKKWKARGDIMKKVFLYPDNPMILYGGNVDIPPPFKGKITTPEKEKAELKQIKLL